jgi:hypothetical protein
VLARIQGSDHANAPSTSEKEPIMTTNHLTRRLFMATAATAVSAIAGCVPDLPVTLPAGSEAKLGFGLWAGVPGAKFGDQIDRVSGIRRIRGPRIWTHPVTRKRLTVYVRTKKERSGTKTSYYTMRSDGTALARVFDSRPGQPDRYFTNDAFMPIGLWRSGMTKSYRMEEHSGGKVTRHSVSIRVTQASFTYKGRPASMEYIWTQRNASGSRTKQLRYVYSPGIGLVVTDNLLR